MRKISLTAIALSLILLSACSKHGTSATETPPPTPPETSAPVVSEPPYNVNMDYMELMIMSAITEDYELLEEAVYLRNLMIVDLDLDEEIIGVDDFLENFHQYAGFSLYTDYTYELIQCAAAGDIERGRQMAEEWHIKGEFLGAVRPKIDFDDMFLLSKIIYNEAGSYWLSIEWKMMVGEVFLNRVASPEYPDTFEGVAYQPSQYSGANTERFAKMLPTEECAEAALRLMLGERLINDPSVIFQANFKQGSKVWKVLRDSRLGNTYLCHSNRMDLYR